MREGNLAMKTQVGVMYFGDGKDHEPRMCTAYRCWIGKERDCPLQLPEGIQVL